uniref:TM100 protein n=1 Tax=Junco hyemalis TaxID=40217 RepID=A0A8C5I7X0_JUNHY
MRSPRAAPIPAAILLQPSLRLAAKEPRLRVRAAAAEPRPVGTERKPGLPLATATDSTATLNKLALATGGTEKSWYRCIFPFGIVSVVIGVAATCITFTINGPQMDIAKVVSVATLIFGVALLVAAYVCWRAKRERQRQRQRQEPLALEQGAL